MAREHLRTILLALLARWPVPPAPGDTRRLLVMRPDHIGDLLFATPALHGLRQAFPQARIVALVGPWASPVYARNPDLDDLIVWDIPWFNRRSPLWPGEPYAQLLRLARHLRLYRFGMAIVLRFDFWWGACLARLAGIPVRLGFDIPLCAPFLTWRMPYVIGRHEVEQNWALVRSIAPQLPPMPPGRLIFAPDPEDDAWANDIVVHRLFGHRPIVIHAGAGAPVKLWRIDWLAQVGDSLARHTGAPIVLTGGEAERDLIRSLIAQMAEPAMDLSGQTTLGQLAALYRRSILVLGPDSGPLHLAVAVGTPTVHLFGPVDPALFGPWGDPARHVVVQAQFSAEPCQYRPCNRLDYPAEELPHHGCMATITPQAVLAAAEKVLAP
jgi:ADP-heptose:LPS heptosyltransferase